MRNNTAVEEAGRLGSGNGEEPRLTNRTSDAGERNFSKQSGAGKGGYQGDAHWCVFLREIGGRTGHFYIRNNE